MNAFQTYSAKGIFCSGFWFRWKAWKTGLKEHKQMKEAKTIQKLAFGFENISIGIHAVYCIQGTCQ
ncbi:hypothetical protein [Nitrosospira sp. Nsp1]|uniref:hypothetical protein n=1 Tax=Nitrosospira sp. Nsp1 TaxID=136547 RepID=UPI000884F05C|nr:hypothetical protein [Nitrosospira sp. Nsp1]SCX42446.1 hypothetical protein SAMN05720354_10488 [Nitrosospira sp. Nsp1]